MKKLTLLLLLVAVGCAISPYRQQTVDVAESLKAQSTALMAKATEPFVDHSDSVAALQERLKDALRAERARADNSESIAQWVLLSAPEGALLGGFLSRWEQRGALGQFFINAKRTQVVTAFNIIIETERAKR
jgi:hypothetical protein